jgi:hypothetical protein
MKARYRITERRVNKKGRKVKQQHNNKKTHRKKSTKL